MDGAHTARPPNTARPTLNVTPGADAQNDGEIGSKKRRLYYGGVRNMYEGADVQRLVRRATQYELAEDISPLANFVVHGKFYTFAPCSLGLFDESSTFRQLVVWLVTWRWWERFVLLIILVNSVMLAMTDYRLSAVDPQTLQPDPQRSPINAFLDSADPLFTALFTLEASLKIVAMGFAMDHGSYLRDSWNILDLVVVVTSLLQAVPGVPRVSVLRAFRVLRPLRTLSRLKGMRMMVNSLLSAIPQLANVGLLLGFLFAVWGILGINLFVGASHARCRLTPLPVAIPASHLESWKPWQTPPWLLDGSFQGFTPGTESQVMNGSGLPPGFRQPLYFEMISRYFTGDDPQNSLRDNSTVVWEAQQTHYVTYTQSVTYLFSIVTNRTAFPWCGANDVVVPGSNATWGPNGIPLSDANWKQDTSPWRSPRQCVWLHDDDDMDLCSASGGGSYTCQATSLPSLDLPSHIVNGSQDALRLLTLRQVTRTCGSTYDDFGNPRFIDSRAMLPDGATLDTFLNADNMGNIALVIFQVLTLEGWSTTMYWYMDAYQPAVSALYFVALTLVGSLFLLNLVVAAIFLNFNAAQLHEQEAIRIRREKIAQIEKAEREESMRAAAKARLVAEVRTRAWTLRSQLRRVSQGDAPLSPGAQDAAAAAAALHSTPDVGSPVAASPLPDTQPHGVLRRRLQRKLTKGASIRNMAATASNRNLLVSSPAPVPATDAPTLTNDSASRPLGPRNSPASPSAWGGVVARLRAASLLARGTPSPQPKPSPDDTLSTGGHSHGGRSAGPISRTASVRTHMSSLWSFARSAAGLQRRPSTHTVASDALQAPTATLSSAPSETTLSSGALDSIQRAFAVPTHTPLGVRLRLAVTSAVASGWFGLLMLLLILLNTATLATDAYPQVSVGHELEAVNFALTLVFAMEMLLKMYVLGIRRYFKDRFNMFDFLVVLLSAVDLGVAPPYFITGVETRSSSVLALRTLRLTRIFKLARSWTSLRVLLRTIRDSISDVINFGILLLLYLFIFSLIGMQTFANRFRFDPHTGEPLLATDPRYFAPDVFVPRATFDNLYWSVLSVFQLVTLENWTDILIACYQVAGSLGILYCVGAVVLGSFILLSLFLAILLGHFEGLDDAAPPVEDVIAGVAAPASPKSPTRAMSRRASRRASVQRGASQRSLGSHGSGHGGAATAQQPPLSPSNSASLLKRDGSSKAFAVSKRLSLTLADTTGGGKDAAAISAADAVRMSTRHMLLSSAARKTFPLSPTNVAREASVGSNLSELQHAQQPAERAFFPSSRRLSQEAGTRNTPPQSLRTTAAALGASSSTLVSAGAAPTVTAPQTLGDSPSRRGTLLHTPDTQEASAGGPPPRLVVQQGTGTTSATRLGMHPAPRARRPTLTTHAEAPGDSSARSSEHASQNKAHTEFSGSDLQRRITSGQSVRSWHASGSRHSGSHRSSGSGEGSRRSRSRRVSRLAWLVERIKAAAARRYAAFLRFLDSLRDINAVRAMLDLRSQITRAYGRRRTHAPDAAVPRDGLSVVTATSGSHAAGRRWSMATVGSAISALQHVSRRPKTHDASSSQPPPSKTALATDGVVVSGTVPRGSPQPPADLSAVRAVSMGTSTPPAPTHTSGGAAVAVRSILKSGSVRKLGRDVVAPSPLRHEAPSPGVTLPGAAGTVPAESPLPSPSDVLTATVAAPTGLPPRRTSAASMSMRDALAHTRPPAANAALRTFSGSVRNIAVVARDEGSTPPLNEPHPTMQLLPAPSPALAPAPSPGPSPSPSPPVVAATAAPVAARRPRASLPVLSVADAGLHASSLDELSAPSSVSWMDRVSPFDSDSLSSHGRGTAGTLSSEEDSAASDSDSSSDSELDPLLATSATAGGEYTSKRASWPRHAQRLAWECCCCWPELYPRVFRPRLVAMAKQKGKTVKVPSATIGCFTERHPLRRFCIFLVQHRYFETVVLAVIVLSSIALAIDSPLLDPNSVLAKVLSAFDIFLAVFFALELAVKVVANGIIMSDTSYFRSGWNWLDAFIVGISIFSLATEGNAMYRSLRALRALRALRPLRVISRFPSLRLVVNALFRAFWPIINVMLVCSLVFLIFAIVFTSLLKGGTSECAGPVVDVMGDDQLDLLLNPRPYSSLSSLQQSWGQACNSSTCSYGPWISPSDTPTAKDVCSWFGADWVPVQPMNFDNIILSMGTLLQMSTTEKWVDILYMSIDVRGVEAQPVRDANPAIGILFIIFMLFGAYFTVNLCVATIVDETERSREELGENNLLTDAQKEWVRTQEVLLMVKPKRRTKPPQHPTRRAAFHIINSEEFEQFILLLICINTLGLAVQYYGMPQHFADGLDYLNTAMAAVFTLESAMKIYALGWNDFWATPWNRFDLAVVIASDVGIVASQFTAAGVGAVATVARALRIGRVLRLAQSLRGLRQMVSALIVTIPSLVNIGSLLGLVLFIYSVAGVQLFAKTKYGIVSDRHANFRDFGAAMLTLWRSVTGETWNGLMYDFAVTSDCDDNSPFDEPFPTGCGSPFAFAFFYSFIMLTVFVIVQLLIAVVLEAFSDITDDDSAKLTREELEKFAATWVQFDPECTLFMSTVKLRAFLAVLPPPMGFGIAYAASPEEMTQLIASLRLPTYAGNYVHFSDVALACARRVIAAAIAERGDSFADIPNTHVIAKRWEKLRGAAVTLQTDWTIQHFVAAEAIASSFRVFRFRRALAL